MFVSMATGNPRNSTVVVGFLSPQDSSPPPPDPRLLCIATRKTERVDACNRTRRAQRRKGPSSSPDIMLYWIARLSLLLSAFQAFSLTPPLTLGHPRRLVSLFTRGFTVVDVHVRRIVERRDGVITSAAAAAAAEVPTARDVRPATAFIEFFMNFD